MAEMRSVDVQQALEKYANREKATFFGIFFKTGKAGYGEGDKFIGLTVPQVRQVAKNYKDLPLDEVGNLLKSEIHEHRLCALLILTYKFPKANEKEQREIYDFYLKNRKHVNNWDLVDASAYKIVGEYLVKHEDKYREIKELTKSEHLWSRRIAMVAMFSFIRKGQLDKPVEIAAILVNDEHDLMHKAVGWMLREIGKQDVRILRTFLDKHADTMPRTALRYAIERMEDKERKKYLEMKKLKTIVENG